MNVNMEKRPPDRVGSGEMIKATYPIETIHACVVKIVPDLKKVGGVEEALRQMLGMSPFEKLIPYLEGQRRWRENERSKKLCQES